MFSGARKGLSGFYYPSLVALILWLVISLLSCYLRQGARADLDLWFSILLLVVTFFVLVGWRSGVSQGHGVSSFGSGKKERELLKALINLDQTESIMLLQQRFISSGFLTASLIHDFKNIIAYIKACAEFGIRQPDTASKDRALKTVSDNVRSGSRAIISLLTSLASGHREERTRFRVKEFLREFVRSVRINYRIEEIQFSLRAREDPYITTRRGELEQVLLNLIRNSAQAFMRRITVEDKKIDISCSTNESALIIELRDNAGGISLDVQARLFEPPSGASPAGFGLYLAHRLVTQNGGSIEFHPLKNGSCFRIQLPK
jgi:signal transduction histidine kinase